VEAYEKTRFDHAFSVSWSQGGEDLALVSLLSSRPPGRYVDVGAHHPSRFSTTRLLYQQGWSGINIEANPDLLRKFDLERPRDTNLNFAVGTKDTYFFQIFSEPAISTYVDDWVEKFLAEGAVPVKEVKVQGITLRKIFDDFFFGAGPDLLCIDAEGSDYEVLMSLDLPSLSTERKPKVVLLETSPPVSTSLQLKQVHYLLEYGYEASLVLPMATVLVLRSGLISPDDVTVHNQE
jgi:FkbM family methyltransferase